MSSPPRRPELAIGPVMIPPYGESQELERGEERISVVLPFAFTLEELALTPAVAPFFDITRITLERGPKDGDDSTPLLDLRGADRLPAELFADFAVAPPAIRRVVGQRGERLVIGVRNCDTVPQRFRGMFYGE